VSYITPHSGEVLNQVLHARSLYQASGASMFGPFLNEWPAWAVEAMSAVEQEHVAVENKTIDALHRSSRGGRDAD
jgi:hypothetical protein